MKTQLNKDHNINEYKRKLAEMTPGFSSADLKNVVNEAAIVAVWRGKYFVDFLDFGEAIERVLGGVEKIGLVF